MMRIIMEIKTNFEVGEIRPVIEIMGTNKTEITMTLQMAKAMYLLSLKSVATFLVLNARKAPANTNTELYANRDHIIPD